MAGREDEIGSTIGPVGSDTEGTVAPGMGSPALPRSDPPTRLNITCLSCLLYILTGRHRDVPVA